MLVKVADPYEKAFGSHIKQLREQRGMTQETLASAARLHVTHLSRIERGERSVRLATVVQLAQALKVQPRELMPNLSLQPDRAKVERRPR